MITMLADQYLAQNAGRKYPLADDTSGIPDNVILDFHCTLYGILVPTPVRAVLTGISSASGVKRAHVDIRNATSVLASLVFAVPTSMSMTRPYTASATASNATGDMTVSDAFLTTPDKSGITIPFAHTTVVCDSMKVTSLQSTKCVEPLATYKAVVSGPVTLAPGYNADPYLDGNRIRLDIAKGGGIGEYCQTATLGQTCDKVMFSINGERPGSDGDIRLIGDSGVLVTPLPDEHAIEIRLDSSAENTLTKKCETVC